MPVDKLSPSGDDPFDLKRFVDAQDRVYETVLAELRAGRKSTHWIWYIFPQLRGLGHSTTARHYGIASLEEARAYLQHDLLRDRLRECAQLVTAIDGRSAREVFGSPDDLKVRSSMTLFAHAADDPDVRADFIAVLEKFYGGVEDALTIEELAR